MAFRPSDNPRPPLSSAEVFRAADAAFTALHLNNINEACLFGSAACALYGMNNRVPRDVDLVVLEQGHEQEDLKRKIKMADNNFILVPSRNPKQTYKVMWYTLSRKRYCKVDVLIPESLNIPSIPFGFVERHPGHEGRVFPVMPLFPLLLLKLQGWSDHRIKAPKIRVKMVEDVKDIDEMLEITAQSCFQPPRWLTQTFINEGIRRAHDFVGWNQTEDPGAETKTMWRIVQWVNIGISDTAAFCAKAAEIEELLKVSRAEALEKRRLKQEKRRQKLAEREEKQKEKDDQEARVKESKVEEQLIQEKVQAERLNKEREAREECLKLEKEGRDEQIRRETDAAQHEQLEHPSAQDKLVMQLRMEYAAREEQIRREYDVREERMRIEYEATIRNQELVHQALRAQMLGLTIKNLTESTPRLAAGFVPPSPSPVSPAVMSLPVAATLPGMQDKGKQRAIPPVATASSSAQKAATAPKSKPILAKAKGLGGGVGALSTASSNTVASGSGGKFAPKQKQNKKK